MPGPDSQPVRIVDARDDDFRLVPEFHRTVIVPSFPPDELQTEQELMDGLRSGRSRVLIAVAAGGAMLGGAVGDYFPRSNVMVLLTWPCWAAAVGREPAPQCCGPRRTPGPRN